MKRYGYLYEKITSFENLHEAYMNARRGKHFRREVLEFSLNLEENLIQIQNELLWKTYKVGRYREFFVYEPKKRLIMALPFRDRVVQWAIYQVIEPLFDKAFINDSYACRKGKGTKRAADRVQYWMRQLFRSKGFGYHLKMDVSKYFYRIDHDVLLEIISRKIKDQNLIWLLTELIKCEHTKFGIPLGDHLYEKEREEGVGIPIGNLISQLAANIYLNEVDQFIKHELKVKYYARYMDDLLILSHSKQELHMILEEVDLFLRAVLKLQLNNKTQIRPNWLGGEFVGYRIWPTHRKIRKTTIKKMKSRLKYLQKAFTKGKIKLASIKSTIMSYFGLLKYADSYSLKRKLLRDFVLSRNK